MAAENVTIFRTVLRIPWHVLFVAGVLVTVGALALFLVVLRAVRQHHDIGMIDLRRGRTHQLAGGFHGETHLAEPGLARQQPGVMHSLAFERIAPGGARRLMADKSHA